MSRTWSRRAGLASWTFVVPATAQELTPACLRRVVRPVIEALPGFARIAFVTVKSRDAGEQYERCGPEPTVEHVLAILADPDPVEELVFGLELNIVLSEGEPAVWIGPCGFLAVGAARRTADDRAARVYLSIDIDIYARAAGEDVADNRALAQINGPRLARFLAVLNGPLAASLEDLVSDGYGPDGEVDEHGFKYE